MSNENYQPYLISTDTKKKLAKLEQYEKTLLSPDEVKELIIAVCTRDITNWGEILFGIF